MKKNNQPIPKFKSVREEAEFWDTHDSADFVWEEANDIKVSKNFKPDYRVKFIPLTLDPKTSKAVEKIAKTKGTDVISAAKELLTERLLQLRLL